MGIQIPLITVQVVLPMDDVPVSPTSGQLTRSEQPPLPHNVEKVTFTC